MASSSASSAVASAWGKNPAGKVVFSNLSPMHQQQERHALERDWAYVWRKFNLCNVLNFFGKASPWTQLQQPIDALHTYFGKKVALYFAFVGALLEALLWPSLLAVAVFAFQAERVGFFDWDTSAGAVGLDLDNITAASTAAQAAAAAAQRAAGQMWSTSVNSGYGAPLYSIGIVLWATVFMERWRQQDHRLGLRWGTHGFKRVPEYRKQWLAQYEKLYHTDDPAEVYRLTHAATIMRIHRPTCRRPRALTALSNGSLQRLSPTALSKVDPFHAEHMRLTFLDVVSIPARCCFGAVRYRNLLEIGIGFRARVFASTTLVIRDDDDRLLTRSTAIIRINLPAYLPTYCTCPGDRDDDDGRCRGLRHHGLPRDPGGARRPVRRDRCPRGAVTPFPSRLNFNFNFNFNFH
jgi:hypothetical protein